MKIPGRLEEGLFQERLNRFTARVTVNGAEGRAHIPNSGRLRELLVPGHPVWLRPAPPGRRTSYDLLLVPLTSGLVSVDARLPNSLVHEALARGQLQRFRAFPEVRREVVFGGSRLDLLLANPRVRDLRPENRDSRYFLEVKSVTLVKEGRAYFPDAVTQRGTRHLRALREAHCQGHGAGVIFVVQRADAESFSPQDEVDPEFGKALRDAVRAGVEARAYRCLVSRQEITLDRELAVVL